MSRWLPYPLFSLFLLAMWLILNATIEPAHVILGLALGAGGGMVLARLHAPVGALHRRAVPAAALLWFLCLDIVRSNLAVARIVFDPAIRGRTSGFISLPLELRDPTGLAVLACIITATPGTSWACYDAARDVLTIHVLDLVDEEAWTMQFKDRYERRLLEIFR